MFLRLFPYNINFFPPIQLVRPSDSKGPASAIREVMGEKGDAVSGQHLFSPYFVNRLPNTN